MPSNISPGYLFLILIISIYSGCTAMPVEEPYVIGDNPGFSTFFISAPERLSKDVSVNGLLIDSRTIQSIRSTVQAITQSECPYTLVRETDESDGNILIDFTAEAPLVPDTYYGFNAIINGKYFFSLPKFMELSRHLKVDMVRFGQMRCRYDREMETSTEDFLGDDETYQWRITGEDIENFINYCIEIGAEAEPELNLVSKDPTMWADMVDQIVNELGYDLKYISAGNEPENMGESDWEEMGVSDFNESLETYTQNFLDTRAAIEEIKPGIIYPFFEAGQHREPDLDENMDRVLGSLNGVDPGAISVHWYPLGAWNGLSPSDPSYPTPDHLVLENDQGHGIDHLAVISSSMDRNALSHGLSDTFKFIGEWNPAWSAGDVSTQIHESMASVVFASEVLEYGKILGFDSLQYFDLADPEEWANWRPGPIGVSEDLSTMSVRPIYYLYMSYKYFYGNRIVPVSGGRNADWSIYASKDENRNYIMLINRTENRTFRKTVHVISDTEERNLELILYPRAVAIVGFE